MIEMKENPGENMAGRPKKDPVLFYTNLKFLLAFIFLACFTLGNFLILNNQIYHAEQNAAVMGFMESQYSLVQKTTFLSVAYAQSNDLAERKNLRATVHEELKKLILFNTTSNDLISEKTESPSPIIPVLRRLYFSSKAPLNKEIEEYFSSLKNSF